MVAILPVPLSELRMPMTLRDFILRYPSSSLSPSEKENLRHARRLEASQNPTFPFAEMAVSIGDEADEPPEPGTAPPQTATA